MKMELLERQRQKTLAKYRKKKYLALSPLLLIIIMSIAVIVCAVLIHPYFIGIMIIFVFPIIILFAYLNNLPDKIKEYKEDANKNICESILETHFPSYTYYDYQNFTLDKERVLESSLFLEYSDKICGKNKVYGKYKNSSFFICELSIDRYAPDSFARWYEFDLSKNFKQEVRICEKSVVDDIYTNGLMECELESINFSDKYVVYATDPETVFYILKPQIIEYLIELEEKYDGNMIISFVNDKLYVVIKDKKQGFKFDIRKPINDVTYEKEINLIKLASEIIDGIQIGTDEEKPKAKKRKKKVKEEIEDEIDESEE